MGVFLCFLRTYSHVSAVTQLWVTHWQGRCQTQHSFSAECRWVWVQCVWIASRSWPAQPQCWVSACHSKVTWAVRRRSAAGWQWVLQHWPSWLPSHWRGSGSGGEDAANQCCTGRWRSSHQQPNIDTHCIQDASWLPGFGDLVLRRQKGVIDCCRGGVTKCCQTQEFDLRETQVAGITRPM